MVNYSQKTITIGNRQIMLEYSIRKIVEFRNVIVVLYYDNIIIPNNIVAFDSEGNQLWKINDILNIKKPTGNIDIKKKSDTTLSVYSDLGIEYDINVHTHKLENKIYLR